MRAVLRKAKFLDPTVCLLPRLIREEENALILYFARYLRRNTGYDRNRINTAITHGPNTAMKAVGDLLGIPVQYYVYTDFQGFMKLVDSVGGVDFYVEKDMNYSSKADKTNTTSN